MWFLEQTDTHNDEILFFSRIYCRNDSFINEFQSYLDPYRLFSLKTWNDSINVLHDFYQIPVVNIFYKELHRTTQQYMICVSTVRIFEFRSHYYAVKCGLILRSSSVYSFKHQKIQWFTCKSNGSVLRATRDIYVFGVEIAPITQGEIIDLSHSWPLKTGFPDTWWYFWIYIGRNSCPVTHLTTQSHHEHSNHRRHMWLMIRTIFWSLFPIFMSHIVLIQLGTY